jgi:para-nitrobenzyl esterase
MHEIRRIFKRLCACVAACAFVTAGVHAADRVKVDGGALEGVAGTDPTVRVFKGVPFAAPPVGDLRWKAPQPAAAWRGVRKADAWGPRCVQGAMWGPLVSRESEMGEDCLYLNVWTTAKSAKERRPVLVVFHGGGFAAGSASEPRCDGEWFAKQGIVVVAPNYRLSVFGFMAHPDLSQESDGKGSGNYGMLDLAAALQWVQRNVAAFGGDPGNVTINGESAGSLAVSALMASPLTRGLVHKAIGQSGGLFTSPTGGMAEKALAEKEQDGVRFGTTLGAQSLAELRAKPAAELLAAVMKTGGWGYSPGVDGYFLPEKTAAIYAAGQQAPIPLLAGWTSSEMGMAVAMNPQKPTPQTFAEQLRKQFKDQAETALKVYPASSDEEALQSAADLASDLFISYSTWKWIEVHGQTAHAPVYRYRFDRVLPDPKVPRSFGAAHASDIEYAFNTLDSKTAGWQAEDRQTALTMATAFAQFVKTGNPNGPGVPEWPEFAKRRQVMHFDAESRLAPETDRVRYEFLDSVVTGEAGE